VWLARERESDHVGFNSWSHVVYSCPNHMIHVNEVKRVEQVPTLESLQLDSSC
jgi:hypothetical protein